MEWRSGSRRTIDRDSQPAGTRCGASSDERLFVNRASIILFVVALAGGCSGFIEKRAASSTYGILQRSNVAARRLADVELARDALPGGIVQMAAFSAAYPDHRGFRELHAEALCQFTMAFVFDDWEAASLGGRGEDARRIAKRLEGLLVTCIDLNLSLLPDAFRAAEGDPVRWKALLPSVTRDQVRFVLPIASARAVRIVLNPLAAGMPALDRVIETLARCAALAPGFRDAEAEILLGSLLAGRSRFFGGDNGDAQFAAARRLLGPSAILVDVMYARNALVARQDRAQFERLLDAALAADLSQWPERRLANELARVKAERYRALADSLIPPPASP